MIKKAIIFFICLLFNASIASKVQAEDVNVSVTGNGSDSVSETQVNSQNTSSVTQNNTANISNNVSSSTNTGANDANSNTGDSSINTGDANSTTNVANQNINMNATDLNCGCISATLDVNISGNGADSTNNAYVTNGNSVTVNQGNTAYIANNISTYGNTGYNSAKYNNGDSTIITGDINALNRISNKNINGNVFRGPSAVIVDESVKISGNGAGSFNLAVLDGNSSIIINDVNTADIFNNVESKLNTGGNKTFANVGDSVIITGNILSKINIENENINSNFVEINCNCEAKHEEEKNPVPTPSASSSSSSGNSIVQASSGSSSSGPGASSGPAAGEVLPATGLSIPYSFLVTLFLFFMLLTGLYLRSHGANAPPIA